MNCALLWGASLVAVSACGSIDTGECPKFVDYERSTVDVVGLRTQVHRLRGSVGEVGVRPVSREAPVEIQRMDLVQFNICQQMHALPPGPRQDSIRAEYLGELLRMLNSPVGNLSPPADQDASTTSAIGQDRSVQPGEGRLNGEWTLQVAITAALTESRQRREQSYTRELRVLFDEHDGAVVQGRILWGTQDACTHASISGTRTDDQLDLVFSYFGSCCNGAQMRFKGRLVSNAMITGVFEPVDAPPTGNCSVWWAQVSGTRAS